MVEDDVGDESRAARVDPHRVTIVGVRIRQPAIAGTDAEVLEARRMVLALTELVTQIVSFIEDGKIAKTAEEKERHRG